MDREREGERDTHTHTQSEKSFGEAEGGRENVILELTDPTMSRGRERRAKKSEGLRQRGSGRGR